MDLENYRNFLAVIETGSLTGAAEYVHVAQPALSRIKPRRLPRCSLSFFIS